MIDRLRTSMLAAASTLAARVTVIAVAGVAGVVSACTDEPARYSGPPIDSHVVYYDLPGLQPPRLDLLVVIDDTTAMAPHQDTLAALPAQLDAALSTQLGVLPDLHLAVTTTGAGGALRQPNGTIEPFLAHAWTPQLTPAPSYQGTLADALDALFAVGAARTGASTPLAALGPAVDTPGFLRPYSWLGIITITASDDASPDAAASYATALQARVADPVAVFAIGIHAPPSPRLEAFHAALPNRNDLHAITDPPLDDAFRLLTQLYRYSLGVPCVREPADLDPDTPGPQYDCALAMYFEDGTTAPIRACEPGGPERCFELLADPMSCLEPGYTRFAVRGFPARFTPTVRGECVVDGP